MAIEFVDRVKQTTTTTGTGTLSLDPPAPGYRPFSVNGTGRKWYYMIVSADGQFEYGIGTVTVGSPDTLSRDMVLGNSLGTTARISFGPGVKDVFSYVPFSRALVQDDNGHVGIGVSNPDARLVVADTSNSVQMRVGTTVDGIAAPRLRFSGRSGSTARHADLELDVVAGIFSILAPNTIAPSTRALNVLSNGTLVVGKQTTGYDAAGVEQHQGGFLRVSRSGGVTLDLNRISSSGDIVWFNLDGDRRGSISVSASGTLYNSSSDYRLKENLTPLTGALNRLKQLKVYRGNFIRDPGRVLDLFLAHEVAAVVPEAVTGEKDAVEEIGEATGYREYDPETGVPILSSKETLTGITQAEAPPGYIWTKTGERIKPQELDLSKLVPLLTASLLEAVELIEVLDARITALEGAS